MKYISFEIINYRAIQHAIIEVSNNLIPIIGINESGKTTALQAILAFDKNKDRYQKSRHLEYKNKYTIDSDISFKIIARILIENEDDLNFLAERLEVLASDDLYIKLREYFSDKKEIKLARVFENGNKKYQVENDDFIIKSKKTKDNLAEALYDRLPFVLYFDDFSDRVPEKITFNLDSEINEIVASNKYNDWHPIIREIFKRAGDGKNLDSFVKLRRDDDKAGLLNDIQDTLNQEVMEDWKKLKKYGSNFASEVDDLELQLECKLSDNKKEIVFKFKIRDRTSKKGRMFDITERSKGFQWFFNFIVKLKFNPKYQDNQKGAIYLLDEPGSYLHTSAQEELLNKLKDISNTNTILYCTHSQYLLDPDKINISKIKIAKKEAGKIEIITFSSSSATNNQGALTPLYQALNLKSGIFNTKKDYCVITEGITDYYLFSMLTKYGKGFDEKITIIPGSGAKHLKELISQSIAFSKNYLILLDSDLEGREAHDDYKKFFGDIEVREHFFKYRTMVKSENIELENLLSQEDQENICIITEVNNVKMAISVLYYKDEAVKEAFIKKLNKESVGNLGIVVNKVNKIIEKR